MFNYTYRITPVGSIKPLVSGSGRAKEADLKAITLDVMKRHNVAAVNEKHDADSILAGMTWRTRFHRDGQAVSIHVSPMPEQFA